MVAESAADAQFVLDSEGKDGITRSLKETEVLLLLLLLLLVMLLLLAKLLLLSS